MVIHLQGNNRARVRTVNAVFAVAQAEVAGDFLLTGLHVAPDLRQHASIAIVGWLLNYSQVSLKVACDGALELRATEVGHVLCQDVAPVLFVEEPDYNEWVVQCVSKILSEAIILQKVGCEQLVFRLRLERNLIEQQACLFFLHNLNADHIVKSLKFGQKFRIIADPEDLTDD